MTIIDLMKDPILPARVLLGNSWLVWDERDEQWAVYRRKYGEKVKRYGVAPAEESAAKMLIEASGTSEP